MPFIILDRDGVINFESENYIKSPDEWHAIPGSLQAIARLNKEGYKVLVASNQSGIARGLYDIDILQKIHQKLFSELNQYDGSIEEIFFCPHHPTDLCACRKPQPGMFYAMRDKYHFNLSNTYFIGDSWSDAMVAEKVGCRFILVLTGNGEKTLSEHPELANGLCFSDLQSAVDFILK